MSFEYKVDGRTMKFICPEHGDLPIRADVLLRTVKVKVPREKKRPEVKSVKMITIRCNVCKRFEEYQLEGLVDG